MHGVTVARKSRTEIVVCRKLDMGNGEMQSIGNGRNRRQIFVFLQNGVKDRATDQCHDEKRIILWISDTYP